MSRREIREEIFKILFQNDFYEQDDRRGQMEQSLFELRERMGDRLSEVDYAYLEHKVFNILEKCQEIDQKINASAEKWKTSRMAKADLTIIRIAVYEMLYEDDIVPAIAINEAVELAKKYGGDRSPQFVNGLLARLV